MLKNWYIVTFAILLTAVGVGFVPFSVPNQELVIQFDDEVSKANANAAISQVSAKLERLGAEDVKIKQLPNGSLKVTYFSDIPVASIQAVFKSEDYNLLSKASKKSKDLPTEKTVDYYECIVSEIGDDNLIDSGLDGHLIEVETKSNRFYPPEFSFAATPSNELTIQRIATISEKINSQYLLIVGYTSRLLPETRAGPLC